MNSNFQDSKDSISAKSLSIYGADSVIREILHNKGFNLVCGDSRSSIGVDFFPLTDVIKKKVNLFTRV